MLFNYGCAVTGLIVGSRLHACCPDERETIMDARVSLDSTGSNWCLQLNINYEPVADNPVAQGPR